MIIVAVVCAVILIAGLIAVGPVTNEAARYIADAKREALENERYAPVKRS